MMWENKAIVVFFCRGGERMLNTLKRLVLEEEGQGMAEYALILVFIALVCIIGYQALGKNINNTVTKIKFDGTT
jgi:pilus assembly protein Flp/PilA